MVKNIDIIQKAIAFATKKHEGQLNQGNPYLPHVLFVFDLIKELVPKDTDLQIAGLLHDTLEDTFTSPKELEENFNERIASLVIELTDAPTQKKKMGATNYLLLKLETISDDALTIKLADRVTHAMLPYSLPFDEAVKDSKMVTQAITHNNITKAALDKLTRSLNKTQKKLVDTFLNFHEKLKLLTLQNAPF